jgi:hypothetical protein
MTRVSGKKTAQTTEGMQNRRDYGSIPSPLGRGEGAGNKLINDTFIPHPGLRPTFSREEKEHLDFFRTAVAK